MSRFDRLVSWFGLWFGAWAMSGSMSLVVDVLVESVTCFADVRSLVVVAIRSCRSGASPFCASNNGIAVPANNQTTVRRRADPTRIDGASVRPTRPCRRRARNRRSVLGFRVVAFDRSKVIRTSWDVSGQATTPRNLCGPDYDFLGVGMTLGCRGAGVSLAMPKSPAMASESPHLAGG